MHERKLRFGMSIIKIIESQFQAWVMFEGCNKFHLIDRGILLSFNGAMLISQLDCNFEHERLWLVTFLDLGDINQILTI